MEGSPTENMPTSPDNTQKTIVFSGEFFPLLDEKKRLTIPARWRTDGLEEIFIVKSPSRGCLTAMPQAVLRAVGEKAAAQGFTVADHQVFKDQFFANAVNCPIDSQGRMVLSEEHCRFAGIKKQVALVGADEKFDLWNPEAWGQRKQVTSPTYEMILKTLGL